MKEARIAQKMPYVIDEKSGKKYWCACGESSNQPYCDGSHTGTEFLPQEVEIAENKKVAWCGCKRSAKGAFCDGAHSKL